MSCSAIREMYRTVRQEKFSDALGCRFVWALVGVYVVIQIGVYVVKLVDAADAKQPDAGRHGFEPDRGIFDTAISSGCYLHRDRGVEFGSMEREARTLAGCMALAAVGFAWAAVAGNIPVALCAMSLVAIGLLSTMGPFWALTTRMVGGRGGGRGCDYYDDGGGRWIFWTVCDGTAARCDA